MLENSYYMLLDISSKTSIPSEITIENTKNPEQSEFKELMVKSTPAWHKLDSYEDMDYSSM